MRYSHLPPAKLEETEANPEPAEKPEETQAEDIEQPASPQAERPMTKTIRMGGIRLVNTASGFEISIPLEGGILGRAGTIQPDHFQNSQYVSNEHVRIQLSSGGYVIVDLESTNGTKVNGTKILSGKEYPIPTGTRITLANLEYQVQEL